ncbi:DUF4013 domain-containing protein [Halonotius terrestris]|uniref:DUF4013 domain-containing protein n=1 Tax=Halonotius terrestris TaxID=2487750 RepID=A0A8J8PDJ9_9EURY|nr:DUF4013 domain-containing protein [Halonotius terrestris]TQQ83345.1 DUF4013 domain-containing protein [Halonotius terrestris]
MEFERVLKYPMRSDEWQTTVLIGGLLVLFGALLLPLFVVYGYLVGTIRESLAGASRPRPFGDWRRLLVEGAQAWLISVVYLLVPAVVGALTVAGSTAAFASGSNAGGVLGAGGLLVGVVATVVLTLLFGYVSVVGIVNFAREERFGAAFDSGVIRAVAFDRAYAVTWLASVVIVLAAGLVSAIPVVGWLLTPFASFYAAVVAANLWADGFAQARDVTADHRSQRDEDPAV